MSINTEELLALIDLVSQERIDSLRLSQNGVQIHIQLHGQTSCTPAPNTAPAAANPVVAASTTTAAPAPTTTATASANTAACVQIKAPMAGTFYRAASTDAPPLVQLGQQVAAHASLGILEAMKMMNDIAAPSAGTVARILVEDGQTVELGQVLLELEATP